MLLMQNGNEFKLSFLRKEDKNDTDFFTWLVIEIVVKKDGKFFRRQGSWLTFDEVLQLIIFFRQPIEKPQVQTISFIEPNISFIYDSSFDHLRINLSLEAKPNWLNSNSIFFVISEFEKEKIAEKLKEEVYEMLKNNC